MEVTDSIVAAAAFGNLTTDEFARATDDDHLVEFCDLLLQIITRTNAQLGSWNVRMEAREPTEDERAWRRSTDALKGRCVALWASLRPRYRQLRRGPAPGYRRAIEAHRAAVLEDTEPTGADRALWAVLDRP